MKRQPYVRAFLVTWWRFGIGDALRYVVALAEVWRDDHHVEIEPDWDVTISVRRSPP